MADVVSVGEDLAEGLGAEHVAQGRLGEQASRQVDVFHVGHGDGRTGDAVVHDRVHGHRHRVTRQHLRWKEFGTARIYLVISHVFAAYI